MMRFVRRIRRFLRPVKRFSWGAWCRYFVIPYAQRNYRRVERRIKEGNGRLRIVFLVNELSKFKMQSVLDELRRDGRFDILIGMTIADRDWISSEDELVTRHRELEHYFRCQGFNCIEMADLKRRTVSRLESLHPDIVFYQQPWDFAWNHHPAVVSRFALTLYSQYYVPNYGNLQMDVGSLFTRSLCRFYVLSEQWRQFYEQADKMMPRACSYVPVGHPMLDAYVNPPSIKSDGYVIYAPHFSISYPGFMSTESYSTFLSTGRALLAYAQEHAQIKWVFKPHPNLAKVLVTSGAWSESEVRDYYQAWKDLGVCCYDNDYPRLFLQSRLLITDCGSFLSEYASTQRPLIRLVSPVAKIQPQSFQRPLFDSFYNVRSLDELREAMEMILYEGRDPKKEERINAARQSGLCNGNCAQAIVSDILRLTEVRNAL